MSSKHLNFQLQLRRLLKSISGRRIAVAATPAAWFPEAGCMLDWFTHNAPVNAFLAVEHGLRGELQDGAPVATYRDARTGVQVYSGFSGNVTVPDGFTENIDAIVFCAQDVSHRAYTYKQTLAALLKSARSAGLPLIVLDRPTPLAHLGSHGPMNCQFFPVPLPVVIPYTLGELARYCRTQPGHDAELTVVEVPGWSRDMLWQDTGLPWIPPSPNIPSLESAYFYAATGLVQATNLSEGRGTCKPFEYIGAPFLNTAELVRVLQTCRIPGVVFREIFFQPAFNKYSGTVCAGIHLILTDRCRFDTLHTGMTILCTIARLQPEEFELRPGFGAWLDGEEWTVRKLAELDIASFLDNARQCNMQFDRRMQSFALYRG